MIYRELVDQIIKRRGGYLYQLVEKEGLDLKSIVQKGEDLIEPLDQIFYTIDFLAKEGLIDYRKGVNMNSDLFNLPGGNDVNKINSLLFVHGKWKNECGWRVEAKTGLIKFKKQGYKTDQQEKEMLQFWQAVIVALLASLLTSFLTATLVN